MNCELININNMIQSIYIHTSYIYTHVQYIIYKINHNYICTESLTSISLLSHMKSHGMLQLIQASVRHPVAVSLLGLTAGQKDQHLGPNESLCHCPLPLSQQSAPLEATSAHWMQYKATHSLSTSGGSSKSSERQIQDAPLLDAIVATV